MRRREFLGVIGGVAFAWPLFQHFAHSQPRARMPRIGVLWHAGNQEEEGENFTALVEGFRNRGYVDGRTAIFEHRYANEQYERFQSLAAELVSLKVDVLVAVTRVAAAAAQAATHSIPIVFVMVQEPVANNFADSLARPGRNMTGLAAMTLDVTGKRLELLKETLPGLGRVALLTNPKEPFLQRRTIENLQWEAAALNLTIRVYEAKTPEDIDQVIPRMAQDDMQAVFIGNDPMLFNERHRLSKLFLTYRLPFQPPSKLGVLAGGLMSYGPDNISAFRRVGYYADRILKGEKPGDLPIEQTDKFELLFNMKTAKALGITIPHTLIARADELIE